MGKDIRIYILSCARSGSTYTYRLFKRLGFDFVHESTPQKPSKRMGGIGWKLMDHGRKRGLEYNFVLHQVRSPLRFMRSIVTMGKDFWKKSERYTGKLPKNKLIRGMAYWCKWNEICEQHASMTYRVEDLKSGTKLFTQFSEMFDFDPDKIINLSVHENSRSKKRKYLKNIKSRNLRIASKVWFVRMKKQAKRYGYNI